jgi:hypothetical protein
VAAAVEIVSFPPESRRAAGWFTALAAGARQQGIDVSTGPSHRNLSPWLLLWGPGAPNRMEAMTRHTAAGGRVIALDLAYWDRDRKARVSFDAPHPSAWVMRRTLSRERLDSARLVIEDRWHPKGKIVIAGIGEKARAQYGSDVVDRWERDMGQACKTRWPGRLLVYRKKKSFLPSPDWAGVCPSIPIDDALAGSSLVITWHSNVAVDAIRLGIPVICRDGAAAAVCHSGLHADDPQPLPTDLRDRFLANLAWFQWGQEPAEIQGFWRFVQESLA